MPDGSSAPKGERLQDRRIVHSPGPIATLAGGIVHDTSYRQQTADLLRGPLAAEDRGYVLCG
jgi:hypothetical protein